MVYESTVDIQQVKRCLLCDNAPCLKQCPKGVGPDHILRSLWFGNEIGCAMKLGETNPCVDCDAPCERACLLGKNAIPIKNLITAVVDDRMRMENISGKPADLSLSFCGVRLENPFLLSSSVVASSYDKMARAFRMGWAGACTKTLCGFIPREASPRYSALHGDGLSFYGFKNIEQLSVNSLEEDLAIIARLKREFPSKVIIVSIMGRDEAEWAHIAALAEKAGGDIIECNFSCPNMEEAGLGVDVGQDVNAVAKYTAAVRHSCSIPVLAKLTPNVTDMRPMAIAAVKNGADGISAINTIKSIMGMNLDTYATEPSVRGLSGVGGYSGCAVKPIALRFIWEMASCKELAGIPISGMGGIETWRDAVEFLLLGSQCVQITTAVMQYGLRIIDDLIDGLDWYLREKALTHVSDLCGLGVGNMISLDGLERDSVLLPHFDRDKCNGCGRCVLSCRDGGHEALSLKKGGLVLDVKKCVGCHLCVMVCPEHAIRGGKRIPVHA